MKIPFKKIQQNKSKIDSAYSKSYSIAFKKLRTKIEI